MHFIILFVSMVLGLDLDIPEPPESPLFYVAPQVPYDGLSLYYSTFFQYAVAAYCPSTVKQGKWSCGPRCQGSVSNTIITGNAFDSASETAGYVAHNLDQKHIIVSFRGTQSIKSALTDVKLWKSKPDFIPNYFKRTIAKRGLLKQPKIHAGFESGYTTIRNEIQRALLNIVEEHSDFKIIFTGHSLGGALAMLAALDFYELTDGAYTSNMNIVTFGQPRVGNQLWAELYQALPFVSRYHRIVRKYDPIPQLPPMFLDYQHAGKQYELTLDNNTQACETTGPNGEAINCQDFLLELNLGQHILGYFSWPVYPWFC